MFTAFLALAAAPLTANNYLVDAPMHAPTGAPSWSDEFSGTSLDLSKWSFDTSRNNVGWFNGEKQYYSADRSANLRVVNGQLIIEARKDPGAIRNRPDWGKQEYSSAKITTKGKAAFEYGFIETRAKLPCAPGTWPAIWMMPEKDWEWPKGGEIDIMEQVGSEPNVLYATLHTELFNHQRHTQRGAQYLLADSCSGFHRYQLQWTPEEITIGVDDHAFMRVKNDQPGGVGAWPFDQPFYLILNLAIGGDWAAAKGIDDAAFPQTMSIDDVRVWKRAN
jgi:beta-glucanase (GH16 family)